MENENNTQDTQSEGTSTEGSQEILNNPETTSTDEVSASESTEEVQALMGSVKATYIPQNKMLILDLSKIDFNPMRAGAISEAEAAATQSPDQPRRGRKARQPRASKTPPTQVAAPAKAPTARGNGNHHVNVEPGKKIKINAPAAGMVVRSDQTLMLQFNKEGTIADILQTENWGYPPSSLVADSLALKAKNTANFLSFQDAVEGYRHSWLVNQEKQEVIQIAKKGKYAAKDIQPYLEKGFSEFMYAEGHASKYFRLPNGSIVASKRMVDLSPEETKKEVVKVKNLPTTATLTGALSGTIKG